MVSHRVEVVCFQVDDGCNGRNPGRILHRTKHVDVDGRGVIYYTRALLNH
jgi:hypothetical protein